MSNFEGIVPRKHAENGATLRHYIHHHGLDEAAEAADLEVSDDEAADASHTCSCHKNGKQMNISTLKSIIAKASANCVRNQTKP